MFTLAYPISLPEERGFHDDARATTPPLAGGLRLTCLDFRQGQVQLLLIQGFESAEAAVGFSREFGTALQCASLSLPHGIGISDAEPVSEFLKRYDGHVPAVYPTVPGASPYFASSSVTSIDHVTGLAALLNHDLQKGTSRRLADWPQLNVAVRLFSEAEFAGGETARFVVLLSALEVLVAQARNGKRNQVLKLVRDTLSAAGREDRKAVCAELSDLYDTRNALLHEAKPVTGGDVARLRAIVRDTLRILVDAPSPPKSEVQTN